MTGTPRPAPDRWLHQRHIIRVAAEHTGTYDTSAESGGDDRTAAADGAAADGGPPFGLPLLAELPELAVPLVAAAEASRLQVQLVVALAGLLDADTDVVAQRTGVGIDQWLATATGLPRLERRTWLRAARLLTRLPQLRAVVESGKVTGGQLRGLAIVLRGIPAAIDDELDRWLADAATELSRLGGDPDALIEQARAAVRELTAQIEQAEHDANRHRGLHLHPRLDGTGGEYTGSEDAYGMALLEALTRPRPDQHHLPDHLARADNLQTALHGLLPNNHDGDPDSPEREDRAASSGDSVDDGPTDGGDDAGWSWRDDDLTGEVMVDDDGRLVLDWVKARTHHRLWAQRYERLLDQLPGLRERLAGYAAAGGRRPPAVLVRAELSTLLDRDQMPTKLLTSLAGGHLHLTADATRTLIDAHGADLRLIITDHGRVVGVGRRHRQPPDWLREVTLALHDTCTGPDSCTRPALGADIDHATAWKPQPDQAAGGRTDLDELGPLCKRTNRNRPGTGWRPHQHDSSGIRTWTHHRTGLTTTTIPATWRPPTRQPPQQSTDPPDNGNDDSEPLPF